MTVARRPRLLLSRTDAATVSSVDWPFSCRICVKARTRSDRSCKLMTAHQAAPAKVTAASPVHHRYHDGGWGCREIENSGRSGRARHIGFHHLSWVDNTIKFG